jgi:hypothetical protein
MRKKQNPEKNHFSQSTQREPKAWTLSRFSLRTQANNVSGREMFFEFLRDDQD